MKFLLRSGGWTDERRHQGGPRGSKKQIPTKIAGIWMKFNWFLLCNENKRKWKQESERISQDKPHLISLIVFLQQLIVEIDLFDLYWCYHF